MDGGTILEDSELEASSVSDIIIEILIKSPDKDR